MILLVLGLSACGIPSACEDMCARATERQAQCLGDQDWSDLGYEDAADHTAWCETWAWEQRLLERDAGDQGRTEAVCVERAAAIPDMTCADYDAITW